MLASNKPTIGWTAFEIEEAHPGSIEITIHVHGLVAAKNVKVSMEEELQGKGEQEEKMPTTLDGFFVKNE
jgi:hypothetical protein